VIEGPVLQGETWTWRDRLGDVQVLFTGRGPASEKEEREAVLRRVEPGAPPVAWARQIHSALALPAVPGKCGDGDALWTREPGLALSVITADCVPVLLAGPGGLAAVHAGWRGIVGGVVPATLRQLGEPFADWTAWIGPAIGRCCYEVGEDVAEQVAAASGPEVVVPRPGGKPHLDLQAAVRRQLQEAGVGEVRVIDHCTRDHAEHLYSYRREGKGAGRNMGFLWRSG
jgi:YfiH family protein